MNALTCIYIPKGELESVLSICLWSLQQQ